MANLFGSLWGNFGMSQSTFNEIFNRSDLKLDTLLNEDEFLSEVKMGNPKIIEFFCNNPANIVNLVEFIIKEPESYTDFKRCYKYPFIASEIFEYENQNLLLSFFQNSIQVRVVDGFHSIPQMKNILLIDYLLSFVQSRTELNQTMAAYFQKAIFGFYFFRTKDIIYHIYNNEFYFDCFFNHIGSRPISEIFLKFIVIEITRFNEQNDKNLKTKLTVVKRLVQLILTSENTDEINNATVILCEIINGSSLICDGVSLMTFILNPLLLQDLFRSLKNKKNNFKFLLEIIFSLTLYYRPEISNKNNTHHNALFFATQEDQKPIETHQWDYDKIDFIDILAENIDFLNNYLKNEEINELKTSYGKNKKIFGINKLKIVQIFSLCIIINCKKINEKFRKEKVLLTIIKCFFEQEWNNILQNEIKNTLLFILDKNLDFFISEIFEKINFFEILSTNVSNETSPKSPNIKSKNKFRRGFLGNLTIIINQIIAKQENCPIIKTGIEKNEQFQEFCQTTLKSYNEANEKILVPEDPIKLFVQTSDKIEYSFQTEKQKSQDDSVIKIDLLEPSEKKMSPEKIINEKLIDNKNDKKLSASQLLEKFEKREFSSSPKLGKARSFTVDLCEEKKEIKENESSNSAELRPRSISTNQKKTNKQPSQDDSSLIYNQNPLDYLFSFNRPIETDKSPSPRMKDKTKLDVIEPEILSPKNKNDDKIHIRSANRRLSNSLAVAISPNSDELLNKFIFNTEINHENIDKKEDKTELKTKKIVFRPNTDLRLSLDLSKAQNLQVNLNLKSSLSSQLDKKIKKEKEENKEEVKNKDQKKKVRMINLKDKEFISFINEELQKKKEEKENSNSPELKK